MGQEIVYCSKCQKKILGADYGKGLAYELENTSCCSACVVSVLETLPPKDKERLLAKMVKATVERESQPAGSAARSTGRIPVQAPDPRLRVARKEGPGSSSALIIGGSLAAAATVIAVIALSTGGAPPPPPAAPPRTPVVARPPEPQGNPEETRKAAAAKEAMRKAREFAVLHPNEFDGQIKAWRLALLETGGTGYEPETKREIDKAESRAKEAVGQESASLERELQNAIARKDFKKGTELIDQATPRHGTPEWTASTDALRRTLQQSAARAFAELKEKAVAARNRGDHAAVEEAKASVARWGFPEFVPELEAALVPSWTPVFDGRTNDFLSSACRAHWKVVDGGLLPAPGQTDRQSGQSREPFGDGELRFRISLQNVGQFYIAVRQAEGAALRVNFDGTGIRSLGDGIHELIFTCKGDQVTATMDGSTVPVAQLGKRIARGRFQFNSADGVFKLLAVDYRPLQ